MQVHADISSKVSVKIYYYFVKLDDSLWKLKERLDAVSDFGIGN